MCTCSRACCLRLLPHLPGSLFRLQFTSATEPDFLVVVKVTEESRSLKFEIESDSNSGQAGWYFVGVTFLKLAALWIKSIY